MSRVILAISIWLLSQFSSLAWAASPERIVFINPGSRGEDFWENVTLSMQAAAEQLGFELEVHWSGRNKFNMQALGIAAAEAERKPDVMILVNEERAAAPILAATEKAGIKTIFLSNTLTSEEVDAFEQTHGPLKHMLGSVVPDMNRAGARMAEALINEADRLGLRAKDGKLHIVAIAGDGVSPSSVLRNTGFLEYVKTREDVKLERLLYANWNENEAQQLTQRFLELMDRKGDKLAGIWAGNDPMAIGAIKALRDAKLKPGRDTVVVGLNWSSDAIQLVRDGQLLLTDGGHFLAGAWILVALSDYNNGCTLPEDVKARQLKLPTSALSGETDPLLLRLIEAGDYRSIDFTHFLTHARQCLDYEFTTEKLVNALKN